MSTSYASVALSYGLMIVIGGVATYIYKPDLITRLLPTATPPVQASTPDGPKSTNKKKTKKPKTVKEAAAQITSAVSTGAEEPSRTSKKRKITAPVNSTVTATAANGQKAELPRDAENDVNDKDFAQQLAKAQAGTKLQAKTQQQGTTPGRLAAPTQPTKSGRSSNADLSSSAGGDADDDLSSVESPQERPASGKDISDMLEPAAAAPTSLRLTNLTEPKKPKQAPKQFEQVESKKKRAERAKREEQKRINEESDRLHEQKKQEQLRKARMASGTSNQTKANNFAASTSNAWQNKPSSANPVQSSSSAPLLDTFEPSTTTKESVQSQPAPTTTNGTSSNNNAAGLKSQFGENTAEAMTASGRENGTWADQMSVSEEEQMHIVREQQQEDAWESVQSKKSKKKGRKEGDTSSEASFAVDEKPAPQPQANGVKTNGAVKAKPSDNRFEAIQAPNSSGLQEDEWAA
ncbi:hypothetical protein PMZ80_009998 [Knufia obscura]|uniref:Uncharacterized protein n=1 Tax=Knufia obscura TaxID=1635080 RepID=A0ABR0RCL7_9EURO|nr:hypothetical protein PMZ80_009998 [Knufia obscura]